MKRFIQVVVFVAVALGLGGCWSAVYETPASEYFDRIDTITPGAGNAKDANAAIHVVDPWPRKVANTRIPGQGERMVNAVDRYKGRSTPAGGQQTGPPTSLSMTPTGSPAGVTPPSGTLPF